MIEVVFFDLGNTLVTGDRAWVPGAKDILKELMVRNIRLGLISNTGNLSRNELSRRLPSDFDLNMFAPELVLFSSEVGIEKPSLSIFLEAVRRAAVSPGECLFCTEDLHHTVAAQRACMRTARLLPAERNDIGSLIRIMEDTHLI
jgi:FMN phosphatase YigB (HAD superfamily)